MLLSNKLESKNMFKGKIVKPLMCALRLSGPTQNISTLLFCQYLCLKSH